MNLRKYTFLFFIFTCLFAFCQSSVQYSINLFANHSYFKNASISFLAIDLSNNDTIAKYNPYLSQTSASTTKLFTTASALEILGPDKKAKTRIYIQGEIDSDSTLNGDLWIRGGCDVSLGSPRFYRNNDCLNFISDWVELLKNKGIKKINGHIYTDGSDFGYDSAPSGWAWSDLGNYYGAASSGICFHDNMLKIAFKTFGYGKKTKVIGTFPPLENFKFKNHIKSAKIYHDAAYIYGGMHSKYKYGKGFLPEMKDSFVVKSSMPDPEFQIANLLKRALKYSLDSRDLTKIETQKKPVSYDSITLLFPYNGKSIREIVQKTNTYSVNFFAEGLVQLIAKKLHKVGTTYNGTRAIKRFWSKKINTRGLYLTDGSGLSRNNAISASHFCSLLSYMSKSKNFNDFFSSLAVAGKSGTLKRVCLGQLAEGRVFAKSGTLSRVKAYAGYVYSNSGKKIAFSFSINNYNCRTSDVVTLFSKTLNALAVY